ASRREGQERARARLRGDRRARGPRVARRLGRARPHAARRPRARARRAGPSVRGRAHRPWAGRVRRRRGGHPEGAPPLAIPSRRLYEFRRALADVEHRWVEGRCASYGGSTAFLPLADMWRRSLAIDDRDDESAAAAKIDARIDALGADMAWTKPFVRLLLSLP